MDTSFNEFLSQNAWWIALSVAGFLFLVVLIIFLSGKLRKKEGKKISLKDKEKVKSAYFEALGGEENLVSKSIEGSRIKLELKDYSLVDKEKIKEAGVDGFIQMSNKLYLVVKDDAAKVYEILFNE